MTSLSDNQVDRALRWVRGEMNPTEMAAFAEELRQNVELRGAVRVMEALEDTDAVATANHPGPAELAEYEASAGSLLDDPSRSLEIRDHLAHCERCRGDIALAAGARQAPVTTPAVVRLTPGRWRRVFLLAAAAALGVAVVSVLVVQRRGPDPAPTAQFDHGGQVTSFVSLLVNRSRRGVPTDTSGTQFQLHVPLEADVQQMLLAYEGSAALRPAILAELSRRWSRPGGISLALDSLSLAGPLAEATPEVIVRGSPIKPGDTLLIATSRRFALVTIQRTHR